MHRTRRETLGGGLLGLLMAGMAGTAQAQERRAGDVPGLTADYGLIAQIKAVPGQRDALMDVLAAVIETMPGNIAYLIGADMADPDGIWVTEYWQDKATHDDALALPDVQAVLAKGRPLIAGFGARVELKPA